MGMIGHVGSKRTQTFRKDEKKYKSQQNFQFWFVFSYAIKLTIKNQENRSIEFNFVALQV